MKKIFYSLLLLFIINSCSDEDGTGSGKKTKLITGADDAKQAYNFTKDFWEKTIRSTIPANQDVTLNQTINGTKGTAKVSGSVKYTDSNSSFSSYTSTILGVTSSFAKYENNGFVIDGDMYYGEFSSYESVCSSSRCASSSKASGSYTSKKLDVEFTNSKGEKIKDQISIDASLSDIRSSWKVQVKNSAGDSFYL